ncbi:MAG: DUF4373 domain-containing protein [Clostridia bacterium]
MARPTKTGLDYYPRDVGLSDDRKFRSTKQRFGYLSIVCYELLLDFIYSDKGYYMKIDNLEDLCWDIQGKLQGKFCPDITTVKDLLNSIVESDLFDEHLFHEKKVLTSKRIQQTFYTATVERIAVEIKKDYWLLSVEQMLLLSTRSSILRFFINRPIKEETQPINPITQPTNEQSKVQEIKPNEIKENPVLPDIDVKKEKLVALIKSSTASENLKSKIVDWLNYKKYQYTEIGLQSLLTIVTKNAVLFGDQAMIDLIDECMANTYKGIIFDKLKKPTFEKSKKTKWDKRED